MVKIRGFDGLTFKPQFYGQILSRNLQYLDCELLQTFNTHQFVDKGLLQFQKQQFIYIYQQEFLGMVTLGILTQLSLIDYQNNLIKKHEQTLKRQNLNEQTYVKNHVGPVIVGYQHQNLIDQKIHQLINNTNPFAQWQTIDGRKHKLWRLQQLQNMLQFFNSVKSFYILDGHHRFQAAHQNLIKLGQNAGQKDLWIQGLVYSTKYIRSYPQFRKLIHKQNTSIIRKIMSSQKLKIIQIENYDQNNQDHELVLLLNSRFYQITYQSKQDQINKTGVEKLDSILKQTVKQLKFQQNQCKNFIKFIPSIMFDFQNIQQIKNPVFLVKSPAINTIFQFADQGLILPPKSTWLQPKPCLHMVIRLPY